MEDSAPYLRGLNPRQREAVLHLDGPLLVLAGAGSGKTRVLTTRIAHLIAAHDVPPYAILGLTFTNKAAREMRERVEALVDRETRGLFLGTFHSFGARLLRQFGPEVGWERDFTILDATQAKRLIRRLAKDEGWADVLDERTVAWTISEAKTSLLRPEGYGRSLGPDPTEEQRLTAQMYSRYEAELARQNACDFDDLLVRPVRMLRTHSDLLQRLQSRYQHILVDEYQDSNPVQYALLEMLARTHQSLTVVGDDDQAIYGFRNADARNILAFENDFQGARLVRLEQNYRSTRVILDAANAVIANNRNRKGKTLFTESGEGELITYRNCDSDMGEAEWIAATAAEMARTRAASYEGIGILYRTNAQSRVLEDAFRRADIPYRIVGGVRFFERREVQDVMAYLRLLINDADETAFLRCCNWPRRGIGATSQERLLAWARDASLPILEAARRQDECPNLSAPARRGLTQLVGGLDALTAIASTADAGVIVEKLVERFALLDALAAEPDGEDRIDNLGELVRAAASFEAAEVLPHADSERSDLSLFVEHVALLTDLDQADDDADAVTMMTLHSAKGLEFPVVFIAGVEEGLLPHARSTMDPEDLEEERRLFYVGITRAQRTLFMSSAQSRRRGYDYTRSAPSRFLDEVPAGLMTDDLARTYL